MVHTYTILGKPVSTTNSQQLITIPIKGAVAPIIPDVLCPHCKRIAVPEHAGERPKRPMVLPSAVGRKWRESALAQLQKQHRGKALICGPVSVDLQVYRALNAGDVDNFVKGTLDAIAAAGILQNDRLVITVSATKRTDKVRPRIVVTVTELDIQAGLFDMEPEEEEESDPDPVADIPEVFLTEAERRARK
jgi:Holliday junction resolvase RusA-like endonuclease